MSTGVTCTVTVDGVRLPDGSLAGDEGGPVALSGLTITWGRSTTLDQPDPSQCSLTVNGGTDATLPLGSRVTVDATGIVYTDPSIGTFVDPSFESGVLAVTGASTTISTRHPATGTHAARVNVPTPGRLPSRASFAPAAFTTAPGGWDSIPRAEPGQSWSVGASVWAPKGVVVTLAPVYWTAPSGGVVIRGTPEVKTTGTGAHKTVTTGPTVHPTTGVWVGVSVAYTPQTWATGPSGSWAAMPAGQSWSDTSAVYVDDVAVLAPSTGVPRTVRVFDGRVTDRSMAYDGGAALTAVAVDFSADLDNTDVHVAAWPAETVAQRVTRILAAASTTVTAVIDASVASIPVSWVDADVAAVAGLLRDTAASVDAILWPAYRSAGPYLHVEDSTVREPLYRLSQPPGGGTVTVVLAGGRVLSGCDIERDALTWAQSVSDVTTRVTIMWRDQTTTPPTSTAYTVVAADPNAETRRGRRRLQLDSLVTTVTDAAAVASRLLARTAAGDWRALGLRIDDAWWDGSPEDTVLLLALLDGGIRAGLPVRITDLPAWAPVPEAPVYVEGATLSYVSGRWVVDAITSRAAGQGQEAQWGEIPTTYRWVDFDPAITWTTMAGVGPPES